MEWDALLVHQFLTSKYEGDLERCRYAILAKRATLP